MADATFHPTLALAELARGRMRSYKLGEREIVLCHTRDGVFALSNICTHALARMSEGYLKGNRLICPLHGAAFDVNSGRVLGGPATVPLPTYATRIVNGVIEVAIPEGTPSSGADPR